jgi:hypothetical protein
MTRDQAIAEAARSQRLRPDAKWVAVQRDGEWVVARIALVPTMIAQTGTATKPPPTAPRDDPYSQREIITRLYGSGG